MRHPPLRGAKISCKGLGFKQAAADRPAIETVTPAVANRECPAPRACMVTGGKGMVGKREFELMKPTAYFITTARGGIHDEGALAAVMSEGGIAGAGLDVFDTEPLPQNHPLRGLDNAVLTGHTGYVMRENYTTGYRGAVEAISAWLNGKPVRLLN